MSHSRRPLPTHHGLEANDSPADSPDDLARQRQALDRRRFRSIPGVLKNAIDWAPRPVESTPLDKKPIGIIGASVGPWGTTRAQMHLRQILTGTNSLVMVRPEVSVERAPQYADADGNLIDEKVRDRVRRDVVALAAWAGSVGR